jgi:hypothetical protein
MADTGMMRQWWTSIAEFWRQIFTKMQCSQRQYAPTGGSPGLAKAARAAQAVDAFVAANPPGSLQHHQRRYFQNTSFVRTPRIELKKFRGGRAFRKYDDKWTCRGCWSPPGPTEVRSTKPKSHVGAVA